MIKISKIKDTIKNNKTLTNAEKNGLQNKIKELTTQRDSVNNEHRRAVDKMLELKKDKKYEELKKDVENFFHFTSKEMKYGFNGFDKDGVHKDTGKYYDPNGFNSYGINVDNNDKYDSKYFESLVWIKYFFYCSFT